MISVALGTQRNAQQHSAFIKRLAKVDCLQFGYVWGRVKGSVDFPEAP